MRHVAQRPAETNCDSLLNGIIDGQSPHFDAQPTFLIFLRHWVGIIVHAYKQLGWLTFNGTFSITGYVVPLPRV